MEDKYAIYFDNVSKDYGDSRGNFDINLGVKEGKTLGLVGENGAGKTTLLRQAMGFVKSDHGKIHIYDLDAYKQAHLCKAYVGYVPGEINFPDVKTGNEFLRQYASELRLGPDSFQRADEVIRRMQLDVTAYPRRMSKGMKQKTAIVAALMRKSPILLLDEPTTGLDPLMRDEFLRLLEEEKSRGATIIMSSNTIEELEKVADEVAFISKGRIIDVADVNKIRNRPIREYKVEFNSYNDYAAIRSLYQGKVIRDQKQFCQLSLSIDKSECAKLFSDLEGKDVKFISQIPYNLQSYFDQRRNELGD